MNPRDISTELSTIRVGDTTIGLTPAEIICEAVAYLYLNRDHRMEWRYAAPEEVIYAVDPEGMFQVSPEGMASMKARAERLQELRKQFGSRWDEGVRQAKSPPDPATD